MKFTLYVDESGDFETYRGEWVIAALCVPLDKSNADAAVSRALSPIATRHQLAQRDFHLWELRGKTPMRAIQSSVLNEALKLNGSSLIAVVNEAKRALSDPEQTYRLMLQDLLALWESHFEGSEAIDVLDIVVASRTIRGIHENPPGRLRREFVDNLPEAVLAGLASRGLLDLFGSRITIHTPSGTRNWGLAVADFLANTLFHRNDDGDVDLIASMLQTNRLALFEAFGGLEERRAQVAERDKDYSTAAIRWLMIPAVDDSFLRRRRIALARIVARTLGETGTRGPEAFLETIVDALHRSSISRIRLYSALIQIEDVLQVCEHDASSTLLLRVRSFMLLISQHRGDPAESTRLLKLQDETLRSMGMRVDLIPLALDTQLRKSESAVNSLNFDIAKDEAEQHLRAVDDLESLWTMVHEMDQKSGRGSNIKFRAQMNLIRCDALSREPMMSTFDDLLSQISELLVIAQTPEERNRLLTYEALCLLKARRWSNVIEWMKKVPRSSGNQFTMFWRGRALNDCVLSGTEVPADLVEGIRLDLSSMVNAATRAKNHDHPYDLLLREYALLEALYGSKKKAKADLKLAEHWLTSTVLDCPIRNWLVYLGRAHLQFINEQVIALPALESSQGEHMKGRLQNLSGGASGKEFLLDLRLISPY